MCLPTTREVDALEHLGFYQETYRALDQRFRDWNYGVWQHRWTLVKADCALCGSHNPSVRVNQTALCFKCLTEYPNVPWHPTGGIRPKAQTFLEHANECDQHGTSSRP